MRISELLMLMSAVSGVLMIVRGCTHYVQHFSRFGPYDEMRASFPATFAGMAVLFCLFVVACIKAGER